MGQLLEEAVVTRPIPEPLLDPQHTWPGLLCLAFLNLLHGLNRLTAKYDSVLVTAC